ncbi:MAG: hypothetical protein P1V13_00830 [Rhizobiaceae bacterium]|nr:hypothetical protein [Rhizobiaceae bacterium]
MATLYGGSHSPNSRVEWSRNSLQIGVVGLSALDDGSGRLTRLLDFNSAIGCHSAICPRQLAHNNQPEDNGLGGSLFSGGFLATFGAGHIPAPEQVTPLDHEGPAFAGGGA